MAVVLFLACRAVRAEESDFVPVTAGQINTAIDKGVVWLRAAQQKDGSWGPCVANGTSYDGSKVDPTCYRCGPTAFAIYTLAKCGAGPRDKVVRKGLKWLEKYADNPSDYRDRAGARGPLSTYESAALVLALAALHTSKKQIEKPRMAEKTSRPPPGRKFSPDAWKWMDEHVRYLIGAQFHKGGWRYWERGTDQDCSATQFSLLALRAAARAGYPVEKVANVWKGAAVATMTFQTDEGGFRYMGREPWSAGMTAAGLASLFLCKEQLARAEQPAVAGLDAAIERGMRFLGPRWRVDNNVDGKGTRNNRYHYYHLYALERVGALSGKHEIGKRAWYPRGAAYLVAEQDPKTGRWVDPTCMGPRDVLGTCFALLFLKKATIPTLTIR